MDPISNVDRLVLILRQRLEERSRAFLSSPRSQTSGEPRKPPTRAETLHALAAVGDVDDRQIKRSLIQGILAENFGPGLINDAKFQQVVGQVSEALDKEPATAALMARLVRELRAGG